ncbi:MAG: hypothetical protein DRJ42_23170 [Deltaproteobacteria bacterium]|nr:MAG: hypothetical protein DRJ42_23170 [Deltaproteobacteria bacterium]
MKTTLSALLVLTTAACGGGGEAPATDTIEGPPVATEGSEVAEPEPDPGPTVEELTALASEAWVYGFAHVFQIDSMIRAAGTDELAFSAPLNTPGSATRLANETDEFVSVNNDTIYHMVQVDVGEEPLILNVPTTGDRYFVLQFVDAWTNNFAYLGTRGTEGRAGKYLIAAPGWAGEVPEGVEVIHSPTPLLTIVGRIAVDGQRDLPAARRIQEQTWVTPLSLYPERPDYAARELGDRDFAPYDHEVPEELVFWEKMRSWMALNPPPAAETDYIASFEALGLTTPGAESPYRNPSPELRQALVDGLAAAEAHLEEVLASGGSANGAGWRLSTHIFDYNLDYFEVGTIDSDEWKIANRADSYLVRTVTARIGLWGQHGYEAVYGLIYVDADGEQLTGEHNYEIRFDTPPPVGAFWSLTMYDHPNYFLVANDANRFSIGDRTRGIRTARDGSITIYMSHERPARAHRSNWLPAPEGAFRPVLRMYLPEDAVTDGTYVLPAITRVDTDE